MRLLPLFCLLVACHKDAASVIANAQAADLEDKDVTAALAAIADPHSLYSLAIYTILPGNCPRIGTRDATTTVTGGCTDDKKRRYFGSVEITGADLRHPDRVIYRDYGVDDDQLCDDTTVTVGTRWNGEVTTRLVDGAYVFSIDVAISETYRDGPECEHIGLRHYAANYSGTLEEQARGSYRGTASGTIVFGDRRAEASVDHIAVDFSKCATEPMSGVLTLRSGDDVATVTYDGETSCSTKDGAATWQLNGADQGAIGTSLCRSGGASDLAWIAAVVVLMRRRRSAMRRA